MYSLTMKAYLYFSLCLMLDVFAALGISGNQLIGGNCSQTATLLSFLTTTTPSVAKENKSSKASSFKLQHTDC